MKQFKTLHLVMLVIAASMFSCQSENSELKEPVQQKEISSKIIAQLQNFDVNTNNIEKVDFLLPDGKTIPMYKMEGDINMTEDQIMSLNSLKGLSAKNYHTNNLVSQNTVIEIIGYTGGGGFGLSNKAQTGLRWAVDNYNRLNLSISFNLTFGTNYQPKDMVVYNNPNQNGNGGQAGFPSGGNPFKFVQVFGLDAYDNNVNEHVIGHEIGHSIGFRHTDWFSRRSCGQNSNEGDAGVGANPIPGTPSGYDPTSIMLACFSSSEDGEFNNNDIIALNYLY